jgi:hypothetical protein
MLRKNQVDLHQLDSTDFGGTICEVEQVLILGVDQTKCINYATGDNRGEKLTKHQQEHHCKILGTFHSLSISYKLQ